MLKKLKSTITRIAFTNLHWTRRVDEDLLGRIPFLAFLCSVNHAWVLRPNRNRNPVEVRPPSQDGRRPTCELFPRGGGDRHESRKERQIGNFFLQSGEIDLIYLVRREQQQQHRAIITRIKTALFAYVFVAA